MKKKLLGFITLGAILGISIGIFITQYYPRHNEPVEVKIGSILSLTGGAASYGEMMTKGMELAKEDVLRKNIIRDKKLVLIYEDSQFDPKLGLNAYNKLVHIDKVNAIVNIVGSAVVIPLVPLAERDGIPILDALSTSPVLNNSSNIYMRICPSDDYIGIFISDWIKQMNKKSIGLLYMNDDWGVEIKNVILKKTQELGIKIVIAEGVNPNIRSPKELVLKIKDKNPDIIVIVVRPKETALILKELRQSKIIIPVIGTDNMVSNEVTQLSEDILENTYYCVPEIDEQNLLYKEFEQKFLEKYGEKPTMVSTYAYATLYLMCEAIGKVGINKDKIINYIIGNEHDSVVGKLKFDKNGNLISANYKKFVFRGKSVVPLE